MADDPTIDITTSDGGSEPLRPEYGPPTQPSQGRPDTALTDELKGIRRAVETQAAVYKTSQGTGRASGVGGASGGGLEWADAQLAEKMAAARARVGKTQLPGVSSGIEQAEAELERKMAAARLRAGRPSVVDSPGPTPVDDINYSSGTGRFRQTGTGRTVKNDVARSIIEQSVEDSIDKATARNDAIYAEQVASQQRMENRPGEEDYSNRFNFTPQYRFQPDLQRVNFERARMFNDPRYTPYLEQIESSGLPVADSGEGNDNAGNGRNTGGGGRGRGGGGGRRRGGSGGSSSGGGGNRPGDEGGDDDANQGPRGPVRNIISGRGIISAATGSLGALPGAGFGVNTISPLMQMLGGFGPMGALGAVGLGAAAGVGGYFAYPYISAGINRREQFRSEFVESETLRTRGEALRGLGLPNTGVSDIADPRSLFAPDKVKELEEKKRLAQESLRNYGQGGGMPADVYDKAKRDEAAADAEIDRIKAMQAQMAAANAALEMQRQTRADAYANTRSQMGYGYGYDPENGVSLNVPGGNQMDEAAFKQGWGFLSKLPGALRARGMDPNRRSEVPLDSLDFNRPQDETERGSHYYESRSGAAKRRGGSREEFHERGMDAPFDNPTRNVGRRLEESKQVQDDFMRWMEDRGDRSGFGDAVASTTYPIVQSAWSGMSA